MDGNSVLLPAGDPGTVELLVYICSSLNKWQRTKYNSWKQKMSRGNSSGNTDFVSEEFLCPGTHWRKYLDSFRWYRYPVQARSHMTMDSGSEAGGVWWHCQHAESLGVMLWGHGCGGGSSEVLLVQPCALSPSPFLSHYCPCLHLSKGTLCIVQLAYACYAICKCILWRWARSGIFFEVNPVRMKNSFPFRFAKSVCF